MENEVKDLLDEGLENEVGSVNRKLSKVKILGIAAIASTTALLLKFRKKIRARFEGAMVKKLTKRGYSILEPITKTEVAEKVEDTLLENL